MVRGGVKGACAFRSSCRRTRVSGARSPNPQSLPDPGQSVEAGRHSTDGWEAGRRELKKTDFEKLTIRLHVAGFQGPPVCPKTPRSRGDPLVLLRPGRRPGRSVRPGRPRRRRPSSASRAGRRAETASAHPPPSSRKGPWTWPCPGRSFSSHRQFPSRRPFLFMAGQCQQERLRRGQGTGERLVTRPVRRASRARSCLTGSPRRRRTPDPSRRPSAPPTAAHATGSTASHSVWPDYDTFLPHPRAPRVRDCHQVGWTGRREPRHPPERPQSARPVDTSSPGRVTAPSVTPLARRSAPSTAGRKRDGGSVVKNGCSSYPPEARARHLHQGGRAECSSRMGDG